MNLKVLFCTSEALPFAASGGLGDVAGSLPQALRQRLALPELAVVHRLVSPADRLDVLGDSVPSRPVPQAAAYLSVQPKSDFASFATFMRKQLGDKAGTDAGLRKLFDAHATRQYSLADQGCDVFTMHVDGPKVVVETAAGRVSQGGRRSPAAAGVGALRGANSGAPAAGVRRLASGGLPRTGRGGRVPLPPLRLALELPEQQ